ncbi:MAG: hypothetical protein LVS60_03975 [Nodosilinea sp. LVE1205-7]
MPATPAGLKQIEQEAKVIAGQLIQRNFSWHPYLEIANPVAAETIPLGERINQFHHHLYQRFSDRLGCPGLSENHLGQSLRPLPEKIRGPGDRPSPPDLRRGDYSHPGQPTAPEP